MLAEWNRVSAQWFLPRYFGQKKIKKAINLYALKPVKPEAVKPLLHQIIHYQEEAEFVRKHADRLPSLFGGFGEVKTGAQLNRSLMIWESSIPFY